jgi:hypothetical protein
MALYNYIRRRSHDDVAFAEFDRNLNFIPNYFLADVACSENMNTRGLLG